jgi:hypothetical protein
MTRMLTCYTTINNMSLQSRMQRHGGSFGVPTMCRIAVLHNPCILVAKDIHKPMVLFGLHQLNVRNLRSKTPGRSLQGLLSCTMRVKLCYVRSQDTDVIAWVVPALDASPPFICTATTSRPT